MIVKTDQSKARMKADCTTIWGLRQVRPIMSESAFEAAWAALPQAFAKSQWLETAKAAMQ